MGVLRAQSEANGEFTRALNVYRRCERNGLEVLFTEELFASLVQSGIRVSKATEPECATADEMAIGMQLLCDMDACGFNTDFIF
eukprot:s1703_g25.t1